MDFEIFSYIVCFCVGIFACFLFFKLAERKALSIVRQKANAKGQEAQKEQGERLMSFMLEVKDAFDKHKTAGGTPQEFAAKELPAIALRYPDVVIKYGTRLYKMLKSGGGLDLDGLMAA